MNVRKGIGFQRAAIWFLRIALGWILVLVIGFKYKKTKPKSKTYLLLANHNSDLDPIMLIMGTGRHARFVASANVLKGFLGGILRLVFAPIPRYKGAAADDTVALIKENLSQGISVAMFPEGNKSWAGETGYISPRTARLVKESGVALVTYRLDGDYMKKPRWAKYSRKGPVFGTLVKEYTADELKNMSEDKIYEAICGDLRADDYAFQRKRHIPYRGKNLAEGMELTGFLCPCCKRFDVVKTEGNTVFCDCGMTATVDEEGFLHSDTLPFDSLLSWHRWEKGYLLENAPSLTGLITKDEHVVVKQNGRFLSDDATVSFYPDRIEIAAEKSYVFPLSGIAKMGAFRTTRVYFSGEQGYIELFKQSGISGIKYFTLWRVLEKKSIL